MIGHVPSTLRHSRTASGTALRSRPPRVDVRDVLGAGGRGTEIQYKIFKTRNIRFFEIVLGIIGHAASTLTYA